MKNGPCPKCGCEIIIQGVRILDRGHGNTKHDLSIAVYEKPDAWVFRGEVQAKLHAAVCGACGFTELYASNLDELLKTAAKSQTVRESDTPAVE